MSDTASRFKEWTSKNYAEQAQGFLNAYWEECQGQAEDIWKWHGKFVELDLDKGEEGSDLDEFNAHRFLESIGETKTVKQMREEITQADLDFNKRMALLEYCLWKNGKKVGEFVKRPQGGNVEEIKRCQEMVQQAQKALQAASAAEADLKKALDELKAQEKAYNDKTESLKKKSEQGGVVQKNKAKAELAQHLAEDPLPLSRAKITTEAATKKAEKARKAADDKVKEAEAALDAAKQKGGGGEGSIWWAERQLTEAKKYKPLSKGGIARK